MTPVISQKKQRIGLFGGTFNPIHFGHLRLAEELHETFQLDKVLFIPAGIPPHRAIPSVSSQNRAEMIALAIEDQAHFELSSYEIKKETPSYTVETLEYFRTIYPSETTFFLFLGMDAFLGLPQWHRWQALFDLTHIIVATRVGYHFPQTWDWLRKRILPKNDSQTSAPTGQIFTHSFTELAISATQIRTLTQQHKSTRYLLPKEVSLYIEKYHLYRK